MRGAILAGLIVAAAAPALAAGIGAAEAKRTFFSYDMNGYLSGTNEKWRECVHKDGETTYWFAGKIDQGRMRVSDEGYLCFSYKSTGYQREGCFTAQRTGSNWRFTNVDDSETVFVTTSAKRVKACPAGDDAIS